MWFRINADPDIELGFGVDGIELEMPNALPLVCLTEESATALWLELAVQLKAVRDQRTGEEVRADAYEGWIAEMSESEYEAHMRARARIEKEGL